MTSQKHDDSGYRLLQQPCFSPRALHALCPLPSTCSSPVFHLVTSFSPLTSLLKCLLVWEAIPGHSRKHSPPLYSKLKNILFYFPHRTWSSLKFSFSKRCSVCLSLVQGKLHRAGIVSVLFICVPPVPRTAPGIL